MTASWASRGDVVDLVHHERVRDAPGPGTASGRTARGVRSGCSWPATCGHLSVHGSCLLEPLDRPNGRPEARGHPRVWRPVLGRGGVHWLLRGASTAAGPRSARPRGAVVEKRTKGTFARTRPPPNPPRRGRARGA